MVGVVIIVVLTGLKDGGGGGGESMVSIVTEGFLRFNAGVDMSKKEIKTKRKEKGKEGKKKQGRKK